MAQQFIIETDESVRILGSQRVCALLDISKLTLWRLLKSRPDFPRPLRLEADNPRSRLRFRATEIRAWLDAQQEQTDAASVELGLRSSRPNA